MSKRQTKRQIALENVSALASIGIQAIEVQKARRAWIDAKLENGRLLKEWVSEVGDGYTSGDPDIDAAYQARKAAAKESLKQARKLRSMVAKYSEKLAEVLA
jgi:hypothetical protein